jgi:hypothetical protein
VKTLTNFFKDQDRKNVLVIFLGVLAVRLILLPWSQTVHADAVSRVFSALDWLANPHYIDHGYWGPLHHYLTAFALWILPNWVVAPKILNILFASLSVFPLYWFTKNVFGNRHGAVFVSLIYGFSPIVMHTSFQALADVSYAFFILSAMYFLSEGLKQNGKILYAILGGLAITLAAATRYESWVIIAAFTLVGLLNKQWKFTSVFWLIAMLFPVSWMVGNHIAYGDFLYSITQNDIGNIEKQGINDNVDDILRMRRIVFFPFSFMVNVSPVAAILILIGIVSSIFRKSITKTQLIWLTPFLLLAAIFLQKAYVGTLMMQHRFIITWIILLLPFLALTFNNSVLTKFKSVLLILAAVSLVPMSFKWGWIDYKKTVGKGNLGEALNRMNAENSHEFEAIPLLYDATTDSLAAAIRSNSKPEDGFVLDFIGWDKTYYTSLRANKRGIIVDGYKNGEVDREDLNQYLINHSSGLIVLSRLGKLLDGAEYRDSLFFLQNNKQPFVLTQLFATPSEKLFQYQRIENYDSNSFAESEPARDKLFGTKRDAAFYEVVIKADMNWYRRLQREGYWKGDPIDTTLAQNARYMVQMDLQNK